MAVCAGCGTKTQALPGPAERGERDFRLAHVGVRVGYFLRAENSPEPLREALVCAECMEQLVMTAVKKHDESVSG